MTLKSLYLTDILENLKRRAWIFWGSFLLFFCTYPGFLLLNLNRIKNSSYSEETVKWEQLRNVTQAMFEVNPVIVCLIILLGILFGIQGFSYLHDKKQVNFYHSQPVKRDRRFWLIESNGIGIFLFTYLVNLILGMIVATGYGCFETGLFVMAAKAFFLYFVIFLAICHISMLAVMLTGNTLVSLLMAGVLLFYELAFRGIWLLYQDTFLLTYRTTGRELLESITSPIMKVWGYFLYANSRFPWEQELFTYTGTVAAVAVQAVVFGGIAWLLYKKRPSEAYGKSISFIRMKEPLRVMLLLLSGLGGALLFYAVAGESIVFGILGAVFTVFLGHVVIQLIYEVDLRAVKKKGITVMLSLAATLIICTIFYWDPFGMDGRLPAMSTVDSVGINLPGVVTGQNQWVMEDGQEIWAEHYADNMMHLTQVEQVYEILQKAEEVKGFRKQKNENPQKTYTLIDVAFYKKNGKKVIRNLYFQEEEIGKVLSPIYLMEEYRAVTDQTAIEGFLEKYQIKGAEYFNGLNSFVLEKEKVKALYEAYRKDVEESHYEEIYYQIPVGKLSFKGIGLRNPDYTNSWEVLIFPGFERTIALLQKLSVSWRAEFDSEFVDEIEVLTISYTDYEVWGRTSYRDKDEFTKRVHYKNRDEIKQLLTNALPRDNVYWTQGSTPYNSGTDLEISVTRKQLEDEEYFGEYYQGDRSIITEIIYREDELPKTFEEDLEALSWGEEKTK